MHRLWDQTACDQIPFSRGAYVKSLNFSVSSSYELKRDNPSKELKRVSLHNSAQYVQVTIKVGVF